MVKPARSGSALGCTVVRTAEELPSAMVNAFAYGAVALLEQFVDGLEVAVPVIDDGSGPRALPAVGIRPDGGVYDYTARYTAGSTEFVVPAPLSDEPPRRCARVALRGARGARACATSPARDLIVDDGRPWCGSSRSTWPPGSPRPRPCRCRSRRPASTSARSVASLVHAAGRRASSPQESARARPDLPADHRHRQGRLPALGPALPDDRHRARAPHGRRAAGLQPHRLRRLHLRRPGRRTPSSGWCASWPSASSSTTARPAR